MTRCGSRSTGSTSTCRAATKLTAAKIQNKKRRELVTGRNTPVCETGQTKSSPMHAIAGRRAVARGGSGRPRRSLPKRYPRENTIALCSGRTRRTVKLPDESSDSRNKAAGKSSRRFAAWCGASAKVEAGNLRQSSESDRSRAPRQSRKLPRKRPSDPSPPEACPT